MSASSRGPHPPSSPSPYSSSPTHRSLSPSPGLLGPVFVPPSPVRTRTASYSSNTYGNMASASTSALPHMPAEISHVSVLYL